MEKEPSYPKINAIFGLTTLKYHYELQFLSFILEKNVGTRKTLHSLSFGHVSWKLWGSLPGQFISLVLGAWQPCMLANTPVDSPQEPMLFELWPKVNLGGLIVWLIESYSKWSKGLPHSALVLGPGHKS